MKDSYQLILLVLFIYLLWKYNSEYNKLYDYAKVHYSKNTQIFTPSSIQELQSFLKSNQLPISIKGAGFSHGGHTLVNNGIQIDLHNINNMKFKNNTLTVEAGATWYIILKYLSQFNRTVAEMQSYYNFSVGGSISTNVHGRGMQSGSISDTIIELTILLTNGKLIKCSPEKRLDLFKGIVGGYSLLGIIVKAKLKTVKNIKVESHVIKKPLNKTNFYDSIKQALKSNVIFYNANIYPTRETELVSYYYVKTQKLVTEKNLVSNKLPVSSLSMLGSRLCKLFDTAKYLRAMIEPSKSTNKSVVEYRSYQIAEDLNSLKEYTKDFNTSVLQEYFVAIENAFQFLEFLLPQLKEINLINLSVRYVKKIKYSFLNYAPIDSIAFVIYFTVWNNFVFLDFLKDWTNNILKYLLSINGKFYLPYLLCYDPQYIREMYDFDNILKLKKKYDSKNKINNLFFNHVSSI